MKKRPFSRMTRAERINAAIIQSELRGDGVPDLITADEAAVIATDRAGCDLGCTDCVPSTWWGDHFTPIRRIDLALLMAQPHD